MTKAQESKLKKMGVFSLAQAEKLGLKQPAISRLVKSEELTRLGPGIFMHPEAKIEDTIDYQIVQLRFGPKSAIGGLTALFRYRLIEQVPQQTWVLVEPHIRSSDKQYRLIRTKTNLGIGIDEKDGYRIVSIDRALIEGLKLASKIGERTALTAVRTAISQRRTTLKRLGQMAKELGYANILTKHFEAIVS